MRTDCEVDPDNQTITLPASFLNTLALGEHSFEAYFSEPESGSAKASFKIVEPKTDDDDEDIVVPNTGALFTSEGSSAEITNDFLVITMIVGVVVVTGALMKKEKRK